MIRVGFGYDIHKFASNGDFVPVCGIKVPHEYGVEAHSDGDVGIHALVDAILGALAGGDIGEHFPPSDPKWANVESRVFLEFTRDLLKSRNAAISNIDITIVCEKPKILPHRSAMVANLTEILDITPEQISIKGKTNEKLGHIGRKEGIAAYCVCCVQIL